MLEKLLATLEALVAAINANTAVHNKASAPVAAAPAAAAETPKSEEKKKAAAPKEEKKADGPTLQELRDIGQKLVDAGKKPQLKEINGKLGVAALRDLTPDKFAEAKKLLEAALAEDDAGV